VCGVESGAWRARGSLNLYSLEGWIQNAEDYITETGGRSPSVRRLLSLELKVLDRRGLRKEGSL